MGRDYKLGASWPVASLTAGFNTPLDFHRIRMTLTEQLDWVFSPVGPLASEDGGRFRPRDVQRRMVWPSRRPWRRIDSMQGSADAGPVS